MAKVLKGASTHAPRLKTIRGKRPVAAGKRLAALVEPQPARAPAQVRNSKHLSQWNEVLRLGQRFTEKFTSLLAQVLENKDPGAARKLRIVIRRLELTLHLIYGKSFPPYARKLRGRIKRCRRVLSELADCDVLLKIAEGALAQTPARDVAAWQTVIRFIEKRRARVSTRSLAKIGRIEFSAPCSKLQRHLQENEDNPRVYCDDELRQLAPKEADAIVQQRILRSLARLWHDFESLVGEWRDDSRENVIHGVRIATKRLRHLVEVMNKLDVAGSQHVLAQLRELQRAIGEWHDMEVLKRLTSELLVQKKFVRKHLELAVEIEELFLRNREIKRSSEERFRLLRPDSPGYREIKSWVRSNLPRLKVVSPLSAASAPESKLRQ